MKVLVQNVEKKARLASRLVQMADEPDVCLIQEINLKTEESSFFEVAHNTSKIGYGTAIYGKLSLTDVRQVNSPHAETGGLIVKKTTVACYDKENMNIQVVSFHGYNGQPFKSISKLVDHVVAVLSVIPDGTRVLFAGDFNTWTKDHIDTVTGVMARYRFTHAFSWPYPGRDLPLDHVFVRGLKVDYHETYQNESDHLGALLQISSC